jgi:hypothetical protein
MAIMHNHRKEAFKYPLFPRINNKNSSGRKKRIVYHSTCSCHITATILSALLLFSMSSAIPNNLTYNNNIANAQEQSSTPTSIPLTKANGANNNNNTIPTAESVYSLQSMSLPMSVGSFVWYIVDEAHENTVSESHKKISDHNPDYLPTNLIMPQGVNLSFLDADAPWDTPRPHTINIVDSTSGNVIYTTGKLGYTNSSQPTTLPVGKYNVIDTKYPWMKGAITVTDQKTNGNLVMGGFYTPTNQVANNLDNDGGAHPGWLGYYTNEFPKNGFTILSEYNFHYATCKYCPGAFWPDQKTGDHTLIIYRTNQPLSEALMKLGKMVWDNVYI